MNVGMTKSIVSSSVKKRWRDRIESNIWVSAGFQRRLGDGRLWLRMARRDELRFAFEDAMAEWTGLEPATPGVTGRYSNQLNYHSAPTDDSRAPPARLSGS